jgi:hypothetical protein
MKRLITTLIVLGITLIGSSALAEIDPDQLSLDISKANAANMEKMKAFIWKKASAVIIDGEDKVDLLNEVSIGDDGKVSVVNLDVESHAKQQRGLRGRVQKKAAAENVEYVEGAMQHATAYIYMSKGQMLDFFSKAKITDEKGVLTSTASDVLIKGDQLTIQVDKVTKLFISRSFSSTMGEDPISGEIHYDTFSSGISHISTSTLNLPAKKAVIKSKNKDYVSRVK